MSLYDTERLQLGRKSAGLSLSQAAKILAIPGEELESLESVDNNIDQSLKNLICETYDITGEWLEAKIPLVSQEDLNQIKGLARNANNLKEEDLITIARVIGKHKR